MSIQQQNELWENRDENLEMVQSSVQTAALRFPVNPVAPLSEEDEFLVGEMDHQLTLILDSKTTKKSDMDQEEDPEEVEELYMRMPVVLEHWRLRFFTNTAFSLATVHNNRTPDQACQLVAITLSRFAESLQVRVEELPALLKQEEENGT